MTLDETLALLVIVASADRRTVGHGDAQLWHAVAQTEGWTFPLARRAVIDYFAHHKEWLMPSDVTNRITEVRRRLHENFQIPRHSPELADDGSAFVAWARARKAEHMRTGLTEWAATGRLPALLALEA